MEKNDRAPNPTEEPPLYGAVILKMRDGKVRITSLRAGQAGVHRAATAREMISLMGEANVEHHRLTAKSG